MFPRRPRAVLNIVFLLMCLSVSYWAFAEFNYRHADTQALAHFWMDATTTTIYPFSVALLLHFALLLGNFRRALSFKITAPKPRAATAWRQTRRLEKVSVAGKPPRSRGWWIR